MLDVCSQLFHKVIIGELRLGFVSDFGKETCIHLVCDHLSICIKTMGIGVCDHTSFHVAGIALDGLDISPAEFQLQRGAAMPQRITPPAAEEITIKFGKGLVCEPFTSKAGKEQVEVKIPNPDPADKRPRESFVISPKMIHDNQFGKGVWMKVAEDATFLQTLVVALGAGLGIWGAINLLEGYGNDNPGAKSQGMKQLMAGGGVALIGITLVPLLSGLFG